MGWLSNENEDSDGTSAGDRLRTLVHLLTAGGVLLGVVAWYRLPDPPT